MKYDRSLPETAFFRIKNAEGGQRGHSRHGKVMHWIAEKQNTSINPKYITQCGKTLQGFEFKKSLPDCARCFPPDVPDKTEDMANAGQYPQKATTVLQMLGSRATVVDHRVCIKYHRLSKNLVLNKEILVAAGYEVHLCHAIKNRVG